jgi:hypothetical protein
MTQVVTSMFRANQVLHQLNSDFRVLFGAEHRTAVEEAADDQQNPVGKSFRIGHRGTLCHLESLFVNYPEMIEWRLVCGTLPVGNSRYVLRMWQPRVPGTWPPTSRTSSTSCSSGCPAVSSAAFQGLRPVVFASTQVCRDKRVFALELAIEQMLVAAGFVDDPLYANGVDAIMVEQLGRGVENAVPCAGGRLWHGVL